MSADAKSINILIAALGGEGGGVLADWLVASAHLAGYPAQSTSIPGVAQRTGATTYYLELFPRKIAELNGAKPVLALTATPGDIDVVVASELIEAGRALQNGFVTPERTTLVASTNRVFAIGERTAMADGRFEGSRVTDAAKQLAKGVVLFDMAEAARKAGCPVNAVMFGALIASRALPLERAIAEQAIRLSEKSVDSNLKGFALGFEHAAQQTADTTTGQDKQSKPRYGAELLHSRIQRDFPAPLHETLGHGVDRLVDYQDQAYARLYLDRIQPIFVLDRVPGSDLTLTLEAARFLALWMSYEDVIRVADLKTRAERSERIRKDVRARDGDIVKVTEFLKPGLDELCSILPARLGQRLYECGKARGLDRRLNTGMYIATTSVSGFLLLRILSGLRWWRRRTWRFHKEQALIGQWLAAIAAAAAKDRALALEIALCGQIVKGYGDTHARALKSFTLIRDNYFDAVKRAGDTAALAAAIREARKAALSDPEGDSLEKYIGQGMPVVTAVAKPALHRETIH